MQTVTSEMINRKKTNLNLVQVLNKYQRLNNCFWRHSRSHWMNRAEVGLQHRAFFTDFIHERWTVISQLLSLPADRWQAFWGDFFFASSINWRALSWSSLSTPERGMLPYRSRKPTVVYDYKSMCFYTDLVILFSITVSTSKWIFYFSKYYPKLLWWLLTPRKFYCH